jgi:hypothetical protein
MVPVWQRRASYSIVRPQLLDLAQKVAQHCRIDRIVPGLKHRCISQTERVAIRKGEGLRSEIAEPKGRVLLTRRVGRDRGEVPGGIVKHPMHALICQRAEILDMS